MVAHPLRERSARCAVLSDRNKLRKIFLITFCLRLFCVHAAASQYSFGASASRDRKPASCWWAGFHRKRLTVRVFVLGGTGLIGTAVVRELVGRGHELFGLARSGASAARLDQFGVTTFAGDIAIARTVARKAAAAATRSFIWPAISTPTWARSIATCSTRCCRHWRRNSKRPRFIYTGGCWLFGATGDASRPRQRRSVPCPPLPGWCRSCSACWPPPRSMAS